MRITMLTAGSRGDVEPTVALGLELARRGHTVTVATHEPFRGVIEERGLNFRALPGDPYQVLESEAAHRLIHTGPSVITVVRRFVQLLKPWFGELTMAATSATRDADLILYTPLTFVGWNLGQSMGIPSALTAVQPFEPTSEWSATTLGGRDLGSLFNRLTHTVGRQLSWQPLRRQVQSWRTDELGLEPLPFLGPWRELGREKHLQLLGYSPYVAPKPDDWPEHVHVTGSWYLERSREWEPPPELAAFLKGGEPPLLVNFGSMTAVEHAAELICEVAISLGHRVISTTPVPPQEGLLVIDGAPHSWLIPRTAGVVHHGGSGTTAAALRAARPGLVIPLFADQPFWAERVSAIGAGPPPIPMKRIDRATVTERLQQLPEHQEGATIAARMIAKEDGVTRAADLIEKIV